MIVSWRGKRGKREYIQAWENVGTHAGSRHVMNKLFELMNEVEL